MTAPTLLQRINKTAPLLCAAALVGAMVIGGFKAQATPATDAYFDEVRTVVERVPYKIGPWIGQDAEVAAAAVKLLKPNKILQRRYINPETGQVMSLLVVHCGNVGDMMGHYPPNCYPAHGWSQRRAKPTTVQFAGAAFPATEYEFARFDEDANTHLSMNIVGFFVLPGGDAEIVADVDALLKASQSRTRAGLGAAQVQVLTSSAMTKEQFDEAAKEFVRALEPALRTVAEGIHQ